MVTIVGTANRDLLARLEEAARKPRTPSHQEILEQRVSFVFGSMNPDCAVTKDQVKSILMKEDGTSF